MAGTRLLEELLNADLIHGEVRTEAQELLDDNVDDQEIADWLDEMMGAGLITLATLVAVF